MEIMGCVKFIRCPIWLHSMLSNANRGGKPFSSPELVVSWSRGLSLRMKPSGSGDENGWKA